jgi:hypothetical protein
LRQRLDLLAKNGNQLGILLNFKAVWKTAEIA